jgi:hypothetical protein
MGILELVFLLLAVLWILSCILPNWSGPPALTPATLMRCIIGLIVLFIVYIIVGALFGAALAQGLRMP